LFVIVKRSNRHSGGNGRAAQTPLAIEGLRAFESARCERGAFPGFTARTSLKPLATVGRPQSDQGLSGLHRPDLIEAPKWLLFALINRRAFPGFTARTSLTLIDQRLQCLMREDEPFRASPPGPH
jgi:hypothetical protein